MKYKIWWSDEVMKCDEVMKYDEVMKCDEVMKYDEVTGRSLVERIGPVRGQARIAPPNCETGALRPL